MPSEIYLVLKESRAGETIITADDELETYTNQEDAQARVDDLNRGYSNHGAVYTYRPISLDRYVRRPFRVTFNTKTFAWSVTPLESGEGFPASTPEVHEASGGTVWVWPLIFATTRQDAVRIVRIFTTKFINQCRKLAEELPYADN